MLMPLHRAGTRLEAQAASFMPTGARVGDDRFNVTFHASSATTPEAMAQNTGYS